MAFEFNGRTGQTVAGATSQAAIDEGLRQYMLRVYNYGIIAYITASMSVGLDESGRIIGYTQLGVTLFGSPLKWVVMLAPLGFVIFLSARINKMRFSTAQTVFWVFAALMGISFATIFIAFTGASITRVFFITAGTFAGMSLYGYTTKKDLTGWGSFLFMGL
ncbi:MAG: Bax inhibitor-1/YccA family protein, partial [Alphaproteobacteria bacterium]